MHGPVYPLLHSLGRGVHHQPVWMILILSNTAGADLSGSASISALHHDQHRGIICLAASFLSCSWVRPSGTGEKTRLRCCVSDLVMGCTAYKSRSPAAGVWASGGRPVWASGGRSHLSFSHACASRGCDAVGGGRRCNDVDACTCLLLALWPRSLDSLFARAI